MSTSITLRTTVTINGIERGPNLKLSADGVRARGVRVESIKSHARTPWPTFGELRRSQRHAAKVARRAGI